MHVSFPDDHSGEDSAQENPPDTQAENKRDSPTPTPKTKTKTKTKAQPAAQRTRENRQRLSLRARMANMLLAMPPRLLGILVLAVALASFAGVMMALLERSTNSVAQRLARTQSQAMTEQVQGMWRLDLEERAFKLRMGDRIFQLIYARGRGSYTHGFARGTFTVTPDLLYFKQRSNMGRPSIPDSPSVRFVPLPFEDLLVGIEMQGEEMIWRLPDSGDAGKARRFFANFDVQLEEGITWTRVR